MRENPVTGMWKRVLQLLARMAPGAETIRPTLNRWRGVKIAKGVWIGYDSIIETSHPEMVTIKENAIIGIRTTILAHFRELEGVTIEEEVFLGPGCIIMPGVTIGRGSMVTAGSVVTSSVPAMTVVQGNPAKPIAHCGVPMGRKVSVRQFFMKSRPIRKDTP